MPQQQYTWWQEGEQQFKGTQPILLEQSGTDLREISPNKGEMEGKYDQVTGQITWTKGPQWTARGAAPRVPAQVFSFQAGNSNAVLYLHMEGGLTSLASRGPNPKSSTVVAKLSLDPTSTVNHIGLQRANRYVEIPPGSISHITFFVRTATGQIVDLAALGASISFILTISERGDN